VLLARYDTRKGDERKKDEKDGAWVRYGPEEKYILGLERKPEMQRSLQDTGVDGRKNTSYRNRAVGHGLNLPGSG
jgi:hypothetical protein